MLESSDVMLIPKPKFELYELVNLYWNGSVQPTKSTRRWFEADEELWWYETNVRQAQLYASDALEPRD